MQNKNLGVLVSAPRPTDYILGSASPITINRTVKDWSIYLPDFELQYNKVTDFLECVTMSGGHSLEMQLNYFLSQKQFSDEALNFYHNNNFIVNGVFHISKRFNAKLNGTDVQKGQYLNVAADHFRSDGFVPDSAWPVTDNMTWDEFYAPVPQNLVDLGKKALWFIAIQYQWLDQANIPVALAATPVQVATEVCAGWDSGKVVAKCSGQPIQHSTIIYGRDGSNNWLDFDHYPPYEQILSSDYELPLDMQYFITMKPVTLRKSMFGANVTLMQEDLNKIGNYKLAEDGTFGGMTQNAVIDFQKNHGLVADGIAGPLTLGKIKDILETPSGTSIKDIITSVCNANGVEPELAIAVASCEGGLTNPNITRVNTDKYKSVDRGIFQFNSHWLSYISDATAFDVALATKEFCDLVKQGVLVQLWHLSQHCWATNLSPAIRQKYGV